MRIFSRLRSGLFSIFVAYIALQFVLYGLRPIMPYVVMALIVGGVAYMIIGRRSRL
jgi:hypothetical protein